MKNLFFIICSMLIALASNAQIISTVAGNGTQGYSGDGSIATSAKLNMPYGLAVDALGNIYFADYFNSRIRKVTISTGIITTVAGNGTFGFSGDGGAATLAMLNTPYGVALDASGNIYIADYGNHRIRKVNASSGIISTVAGTGIAGYNGDGITATTAQLNTPSVLVLDALGNIYIADQSDQRIRKVAASTGIITTVAGNGTFGFSGDGGAAISAMLSGPSGISLDASSNIYIADQGNQRIRKVTVSTGVISTVVGNGTQGYSGDGSNANIAMLNYPVGVDVDAAGNIYIADYANNRIRKVTLSTGFISTVAGNGTAGYSGDGSEPTTAQIVGPSVVTVDAFGSFYIAEPYDQRIRKVTMPPTITSFTSTTGATGTTVTINGTNLTGATSVSIGGTAASSVTVVNSTTVTAVVGSGSTGTISITTPGGTAVSSGTFTFIPAPAITSFTPTSGAIGATVTITGTNLTGTSAVSIGGTSAGSITVVDANTVTALVESGTTGTISLTTAGGTAVSSGTFTYIPAPTITSFTPTNGSNGNTVTITGTNLNTTSAVSIGGTAASSFTVNSDTQVTATIGTGKTGTIGVTTLGGTATSTGTFTYNIVSTAGGLAAAITAAGYNLSTMTNLTFTGTIDARDFKTMRDDMPLLAVLDMSGATISAYTGTLGTGGTSSIVYPVNEIPLYAFCSNTSYAGKVSLTSLAMPTSITSIGISAFYQCSGLTGSLTIPNSVGNIGDYAFYGCSGLTGNLIIPNAVTIIGDYAFRGCSGLAGSLSIGSAVTKIGASAFQNCSSLTGSLTIPNAVTTIGDFAFDNCYILNGNLIIGSAVTTIGAWAFRWCFYLTGNLTIPNSVTTIGDGAFYDCFGLTGSLTIGNAVTTIGNLTFYSCSGLTGSLTIPNTLTFIGDDAFNSCNGFTGSLTIPNSVTTIGNGVFFGCTHFTTVSIPSSVSTIGGWAFYNCTSLSSIYAHPATPTNLTASTDVFYGVNKTTCKLHVPSGSGSLYAAANQWMDFTNISEGFIAPTLTTEAVSTITGNTATGNGTITNLGDVNPTQYGVVWNTSTNPDISLSTKTTQGAKSATGAFTSSITGLTPNTQYYVKAYATNGAGTSYGTEVTFTTLPAPTISSFTPTNGCTGTTVTITGTDFSGATAVSFGGNSASSFTVVNPTTITAVYGSGTTGKIGVTTAEGTVNSNANFTEGSFGTFAYIANSGSNTVSVINTVTNAVTATVVVGSNPFGVSVSPDGSKVYVTNTVSNTVSVINTATNAITATVAVGANPNGISVSPDGNKVYVVNGGINTLSVINTATNAVTATVAVGAYPIGVSVSPDGSRVYVANNNSNNVSVINTATNTVTSSVAVGTGPIGVSVSPDGSKVYVANERSNTVSVINTATNTVTATVAVGTIPYGVIVSPDGSRVYVANNNSNNVSAINTATNAVIATITVTNPNGVSVSPDGSKLYVANYDSNTVSVINTTTNTVTATAAVGTGPCTLGNFIGNVVTTCIPAPTITNFTPTSGGTGATVTITGTNLTGTSAVSIGGTSAGSVTVVDANTVTAVVENGTTGTISLTTLGGTAVSSGIFTFIDVPTITSFTPTTATTGATVTITGTNLTGTSAVSIGGTSASSVTVVNATTVTTVVGNGTTGTISLTTAGGTVVSSGTFTYVLPTSDVVYSVTVPPSTKECYINGLATGGVFIAMTKMDATHYSITINTATPNQYLYFSGADVTYIEKDASMQSVVYRTHTANDVVENWAKIYVPVASGSNITITFSGSGASSTVGDVLVQNLTKGTSVIVPSGNVLYLYDVPTAVTQTSENKDNITVYHNMADGSNTVSFYSKIAGSTQMNAYGVDGRKLVGIVQNLSEGQNSFKVVLPKGAYIVQVIGNGYGYTAKMINPTNEQSKADIQFMGNEKVLNNGLQKSKNDAGGITYMLYAGGDQLIYTAVSGDFSTVVTDSPSVDKTTNFDFVACQDADLNNYKIVTIGSQTWMAENLKTTKYRNGESIIAISSYAGWGTLAGAWCDYDYSAFNGNKYGNQYNWYAVADNRNIAPIGWHVATIAELNTLVDYLGGDVIAGGKLKESGTANWTSPNIGATNETGFSALPGGYGSGGFSSIGNSGLWWSATPSGTSDAWCSGLDYSYGNIGRIGYSKSFSFSVRCIKDVVSIPTLTTTVVSSLSATTASSGGNITNDGGAAVTVRGVCWSTTTAPNIALTTKTSDGTGIGAFSSSIIGLNASTTYYVRAYATNNVGTAYGNEVSFTTLATPITDIDGNVYHSITIGTQTWMVENLKTTKYRNGDAIPNVTDGTAWAGLSTGAWCDYNNTATNGPKYGHLYNFYAVADTRNIAPLGWHVATDAEWTTLTTYLGGNGVAGGKLKETGTTNWISPNSAATNETGFSAQPSGYRSDYNGAFDYQSNYGFWWTSSVYFGTYANCIVMYYNTSNVFSNDVNMTSGLSVRCIKDATSLPIITTTDITIQSSNSASGGGNISSDGGAAVTARGVCWSTTAAPNIALTTKTSDGTGIGAFSSSITGLIASTTYYVRAYATNNVGTTYGNEVSFTTPAAPITDIDGNVYHSVTIGTQTWMVENLKTTKYRNGDAIPSPAGDWSALTSGAQAAYNNDAANATKYGLLYNWYAVVDSRNIAPVGWHVPTDAEWTTLTTFLGGEAVAGGKLKEVGTINWTSPNISATNETGFSALPGGVRGNGTFSYFGFFGFWWTATETNATESLFIYMHYDGSSVSSNLTYPKSYGFSVRCIKD